MRAWVVSVPGSATPTSSESTVHPARATPVRCPRTAAGFIARPISFTSTTGRSPTDLPTDAFASTPRIAAARSEMSSTRPRQRLDEDALLRHGLQRVVPVPQLARQLQQLVRPPDLRALLAEQDEDGDERQDRDDRRSPC